MTREEYDECVSKLDTGTLYEQVQASFLLELLPTYDSKTPFNEAFKIGDSGIVRDKLDNLIEELDRD